MFEPKKEYLNKKYWDNRSTRLLNQNLSFSDRLNEYIIETKISLAEQMFKEYKPQTVADAGCGVGAVVVPLAKKYQSIDFFAIDFSERNLEQLPSLPNLSIVNSVVWDMPFPAGEIDLLFSFDVLYHLLCDQKRLTLNEFHRVSKHYYCNFRGEEITPLFYYEFLFRKLRLPELIRDRLTIHFTAKTLLSEYDERS